MSTQSHYLKKIQGKAVQAVVDDLVDEKQGGWKSRTARDSYMTKLQCLELMGIKITRDALYKRVERQSKRQQNGAGNPEPIQEAAPIEEVATYLMIMMCHPSHLHLTKATQMKVAMKPWCLRPKQEDLRVACIRRRDNKFPNFQTESNTA